MPSRTLIVRARQAGPIPLDVSFTCEPGQVLAIFGPSGSGKTTLLRTIAGLHEPVDGLVRVGAETWFDSSAGFSLPVHRRAVGFVFQDYALFPHLTAAGNVKTALGHLSRSARRARVESLLRLVHLSTHADRRPAALSGGERQRVALARALAREPAVLLLDEPFAAMDRAVRARLQEEIEEIRRALAIPLVLVTHDFDDVLRLATHLLLLDQGKAVAAGTLEDLTSRPDLPWLRHAAGLGSLFEATVSRLHRSRGLVELAFEGGVLMAPGRALQEGMRLRLRIPAREVILATEPPRGLSLHNVVAGRVTALHEDPSGDHVTVQIAVGDVRLLSEVTRDAVAQLGIGIGRPIHALIKSLSLEVRGPGQPPRPSST